MVLSLVIICVVAAGALAGVYLLTLQNINAQKKAKQQYGAQLGTAVLGALGMGQNTQSIVQAIAAQGFNFANLKYSRNHENEADHIGLIIAAMAGYNPQVAISFWQRMAASSSSQTAEFLSDHPSDATRINNIKGWMPEALKYYKK